MSDKEADDFEKQESDSWKLTGPNELPSPVGKLMIEQTEALKNIGNLRIPSINIPKNILEQHTLAANSLRKAFDGNVLVGTDLAKSFSQSIEPLRIQMQKFSEAMKPLHEAMQQAVQPLIERIREIPPIEWVGFQLKFKLWPVDDVDLVEYLCERAPFGGDFDNVICQYYSEKNWNNLKLVVDEWRNCESIGDRFAILNDCFNALKHAEGTDINMANALIPTLVCQLEGITGPRPRKKYKDVSFAKQSLSEMGEIDRYLIFCATIHEVFKGAKEFRNEKEMGITHEVPIRNPLMHGDKMLLDYGTTDNLIRIFLMIDCAIKDLMDENAENGVAA